MRRPPINTFAWSMLVTAVMASCALPKYEGGLEGESGAGKAGDDAGNSSSSGADQGESGTAGTQSSQAGSGAELAGGETAGSSGSETAGSSGSETAGSSGSETAGGREPQAGTDNGGHFSGGQTNAGADSGGGTAGEVGGSDSGAAGAATEVGGRASSGGSNSGGTAGQGTGGEAEGGANAGGTAGQGAGGATSGGATSGGSGSGGSSSQKFVGNTTTSAQVRSDFITYWDQITPENEGKWGSVEAVQGTFNWAPVDRVSDYADQHDIPFGEHCFLWGAQQPTWVDNSNAETAVRTWMQEFCDRYPNVSTIIVVNEPPPHTTPVYKDGIGGDGDTGLDWMVNAFTWAHEYCQGATLILNDYNNIEYTDDNNSFIGIAKTLVQAGAPIDAVGCEAHSAYNLSTAAVQGYLDNIASQTGLPIYITQYDIPLADDAAQASVMQSQFTMFWNDNDIVGITLWGYIIGATWRANTGLVSTTGTTRPAMTWLMNFLGR